jgi:hypothetical protein
VVDLGHQQEGCVMSDLTVATIILQQLGGNRFRAMTGAKDFVGGATSLSFRLPKANRGINGVYINLEPSDTYKIEFVRVRNFERKVVETCDDVYCDSLQDVFTRVTGLHTRL